MPDSDDMIVLKHTWSLAPKAHQQEFRDIIAGERELPASSREPYAAPISIWQRMPDDERAELLVWIDTRMEMPPKPSYLATRATP